LFARLLATGLRMLGKETGGSTGIRQFP
jgi:hypothetical protein